LSVGSAKTSARTSEHSERLYRSHARGGALVVPHKDRKLRWPPRQFGQRPRQRRDTVAAVGVDLRKINITPAVRAKIGSKHGITRVQVLAACTNVIRTAWHTDERGRRLYLEGYT
jgi:hypothetical protein